MTPLNDRVKAWLSQNNIPFSADAFSTFQPGDEAEQIGVWNSEKLGPQPSLEALAAVVVKQISPLIEKLEGSITERMKREVLLGKSEVNPVTGKTALQQITEIELQIAALRMQA
jgi:hypothetical protein